MNSVSQQLLDAFEQLPDVEKQQVAAEILRRTITQDALPLSDEALVLNAEALFLSLDESEAEYEHHYSEPRCGVVLSTRQKLAKREQERVSCK